MLFSPRFFLGLYDQLTEAYPLVHVAYTLERRIGPGAGVRVCVEGPSKNLTTCIGATPWVHERVHASVNTAGDSEVEAVRSGSKISLISPRAISSVPSTRFVSR